jgi:anti-sigma B factor antagonist
MAVVHTSVHDGWVIVALRGDLDLTGTAQAAATVAASAPPGQLVIVDLAGLDFIDCSALTALVAARQRARRDGGDVLLAAPHGLVLRLLTLTGLDDVFRIYPSVAAATARAGPQPRVLRCQPADALVPAADLR